VNASPRDRVRSASGPARYAPSRAAFTLLELLIAIGIIAILSSLLLFAISQIFPLYLILFPPNQAYAVFGVFLVFTFWLYLLGLVLVLGAELNAFLQEPARSVALAEATRAAQQGQAAYDQQTGKLRAEAAGSAPAMQGGGDTGVTGDDATASEKTSPATTRKGFATSTIETTDRTSLTSSLAVDRAVREPLIAA